MVLASTSPRRRELLALLGIPFIVHPADVDEGPLAGEPPADMVVRLSVAKVRRVAQEKPHRFIVGSDTSVSLRIGDEWRVYGKPADREDARRMLSELGGRDHWVHTGYAVLDRQRGVIARGYQVTKVWLRRLDPSEEDAYLATGIADDKAGAYAVQDRRFALVQRLEGSAAATMGLPVCPLRQVLLKFGLPVADTDSVVEGCSRLTGMECVFGPSGDCPGWVRYVEEAY
jgi:septum formation protein